MRADDVPVVAEMVPVSVGGENTAQWVLRTLDAPTGLGLVAADGDPLLGFVLGQVVGIEAEIHDLRELPDLRRRGIGTHLLAAFERAAAAMGAQECVLEVRATNVNARCLYATQGFVQVGHRESYYPDGGDALVLRHAWGTP